MKKIEYTCNLCRRITKPHDIFSLYWSSSSIPQKYIISKDFKLSDNHICTECIVVIESYLKRN